MLRPTASEEDELLAPGALIAGRFVVEALLGRGGAAAVYRVAPRSDFMTTVPPIRSRSERLSGRTSMTTTSAR